MDGQPDDVLCVSIIYANGLLSFFGHSPSFVSFWFRITYPRFSSVLTSLFLVFAYLSLVYVLMTALRHVFSSCNLIPLLILRFFLLEVNAVLAAIIDIVADMERYCGTT